MKSRADMPDKYKPREFSNKANDMLDEVFANEMKIDGKARGGLISAKDGDIAQIIIDLADIRNLAIDARGKIGRARRGEYD